jgi:hypothetical protein
MCVRMWSAMAFSAKILLPPWPWPISSARGSICLDEHALAPARPGLPARVRARMFRTCRGRLPPTSFSTCPAQPCSARGPSPEESAAFNSVSGEALPRPDLARPEDQRRPPVRGPTAPAVSAGDRTALVFLVVVGVSIPDVMHVAKLPSFSRESTASEILPSCLLDSLSAFCCHSLVLVFFPCDEYIILH